MAGLACRVEELRHKKHVHCSFETYFKVPHSYIKKGKIICEATLNASQTLERGLVQAESQAC